MQLFCHLYRLLNNYCNQFRFIILFFKNKHFGRTLFLHHNLKQINCHKLPTLSHPYMIGSKMGIERQAISYNSQKVNISSKKWNRYADFVNSTVGLAHLFVPRPLEPGYQGFNISHNSPAISLLARGY